ncbi:MAG TPA: HAD family hydrolase [Gemmatimonadales bacterium]|nr:HAD family hydrolase [Gemmatimonadales bacterium]
MSRPLALLFDFGGTLDADGVHWAPRFHAAYRAAGGTADFASFEPAFRASDRALADWPGIGSLGFRATLDLQARLVCERLPDRGQVEPARIAAAFHSDAVRTVTRNRPVLERLGRAYRLGVVSNFTGNLEPCLAELDLRRLFGVATDSTVVGARKPERAIFDRTLAALETPAGSAWMVGDNVEADLRPAVALGMGACWLAPADRAAPAGLSVIRIARLPDLEQVLSACTD